MAEKKSANLLPEYIKSNKNSKFLSSTIDQFIQTPKLERIDGYVGSVETPNFDPTKDFYIKQDSYLRENYAIEPALVLRDSYNEVTDVVSYDDLINEIGILGGKNNNIDRIFRSKFYSFDPLIEWDKLVNYQEYYWLPNGPDPIPLFGTSFNIEADIVGQPNFTMPNGYELSNGMMIFFSEDVVPSSYRNKNYIVEGVGNAIKLVDFSLLIANENLARVYNETWDSDKFDEYPFDGDARLPLDPSYITINKSSLDLNPWSRYNRWFHKDIIRITAEINGKFPVYPNNLRAKRPIIEFKSDIQLYNFGKRGIRNIDLIDNDTVDAFLFVNGTFGYYIDEKLLEPGQRVIFNADKNDNVRGKIYRIEFNTTGPTPTIILVEDTSPINLDCVSVNEGSQNKGSNWYYNEELNKWFLGQQCTTLNQPPLFDLFDNAGLSYTRTNLLADFTGSKIFGYDIGNGRNDEVLGFPLNYKNSLGVGSYLFKNYFMTDVITITENNVSRQIPTGITFIKRYIDNDTVFVNVWNETAVDYQIPIIEHQIIEQNTSTVLVNSIDKDTEYTYSLVSYVNGVKVDTTNTLTNQIVVNFPTELKINDLVTLKITTDKTPNQNGFYDTPLGLKNNPLNGAITDMTLAELTDHVSSMVERAPNFSGTFPGISNLRDIDDYTKYGTRLIVNSNPISFAKIFLGKKEHNLLDALTAASLHYNQFKLGFINALRTVDEQLSPVDAVDQIITRMNVNKDIKSSYYSSDMLGYGNDKSTNVYTISTTVNTEFPISIDFNLTTLSFNSILVYLNDRQLSADIDYQFGFTNDYIEILTSLVPGDTIKIVKYNDTRGSFVPATPSKLGLYPKYEPKIIVDNSYSGDPVEVIIGHDGSIIKTYNDYRDEIILELEKRIYNNIKTNYNSKIFDIFSVLPGAFRENEYSLTDVNEILNQYFVTWTGLYNIDSYSNNTFEETNSLTWNYKGCIDNLFDSTVSGSWRALFKYFYDTDRPDTHPWEMLGIQAKPAWWDSTYGPAPYLSTNTLLWTDLENGYVRDTEETLSKYIRPGLSSIIPVDSLGQLLKPDQFLVRNFSYDNQKSAWEFGDMGPAETAWRRSSFYPFALNFLAALLKPVDYASRNYDLSRTSLNSLGQLTYTEDDLYLNPSKLKIETEDNDQVSGYGYLVYENGRQKNVNYAESLRQDLNYLNFNLFHKLGGFASKDKLKIYIDSIDPLSNAPGAVLPPEDYNLILNSSNPIKTVSASGIIIQKSNGKYIVNGYDKEKPYFQIYKPLPSLTSGAITIGGVSEAFSEWTNQVNNNNSGLSPIDLTSAQNITTRYYKQGQIVRYNNKFYRVKVGHTAQATFDPNLFVLLPALPIVGGATAQLPAAYETTITTIPYGKELGSIQEVYNFIVGYGKFLESEGFAFNYYSTDLNEIIDWKFSAKEFLYWTTQNWADNNLITLSPFAKQISFSFDKTIVDNISGGKYQYSLLKADGKSFPVGSFRLSREGSKCTVDTIDTEEGIFFTKFYCIQKEHGIVINNTTIFNDIIYDIETGYKQRRIRLSGFRTAEWNGDLSSPGFVYDNVNITDWQPFVQYPPGKVVRYNGLYYESNEKVLSEESFDFTKWTKLLEKPVADLLPNFDYKINQFEDFYSLDIDNFDQAQQQLAQHLIGYTPRTYLNDIFSNDISQYKFYQGFIKEKGTRNAIDKISKAGKFIRKGSVDLKEEWAFRTGQFGAFSSYSEIEFPLEEGSYLENPYVVKFADSIPVNPNGLIHYTSATDLLITPDDYTVSQIFNTIPSTFSDNNLELLTAGYVRLDDVTSTAYNKNSLLDIANNTALTNGDTIWLGFLENGDWSVYRYTKQPSRITGVFVSAPGEEITFVTNLHHGLVEGDIISIVRFNSQVDGVYIVKSIPRLNQFVVSSTLATITNDELITYGSLFKFENARFADFRSLSNYKNIVNLNKNSKLWIDKGNDDKWSVYENIVNFNTGTIYTDSQIPSGQRKGFAVYTTDDSSLVLTSSPGWSLPSSSDVGKVAVYEKFRGTLDRLFEYTLNSNGKEYSELSTATEFGYSLIHDVSKNLFIAGSPAASKIRRANAVANTLAFSTGTGTVQVYEYEGVVKISARATTTLGEETKLVLVHPNATNSSKARHARFGHSLYINQVSANTSTLLLVGSPGDKYFNGGSGNVYAYRISTSTSVPYITVTENSSTSIMVGYGASVKSVTVSTSSLTVSVDPVTVAFSAPELSGGVQATGSVVKTGNTVTSVIITNGGSGYTSAPSVTFSSISGTMGSAAATISTPAVSLSANNEFGYKISGNKEGSIIAISAPGYQVSLNQTGIVQIFDSNLYFKQKISAPNDYYTRFGEEVVVSSTGKYLFISSIAAKESTESAGKVAVYVLQNDVYQLNQILDNPVDSNNLKFGINISLSENEDVLTISSLGTNQSRTIDFDSQSRKNKTTFDGDTTNFYSAIHDSGSVHVYNNLGGYFIHADELFDPNDKQGRRFGHFVKVTNDAIYVGSPSYSSVGIKSIATTTVTTIPLADELSFEITEPDTTPGVKPIVEILYTNNSNGTTKTVSGFNITSPGIGYRYTPTAYLANSIGSPVANVSVQLLPDESAVIQFTTLDPTENSWSLKRYQPDTVNVNEIKRISLIDTQKEEIIEYLDTVDPLKGKILGLADQEIKYKGAFDPAVYTIGQPFSTVDADSNWLDENVGELWWDLSTAKFLWYEQGDEIFRKNNWGKLFPGASIDVYEWVKSDLLPSEWAALADTNEGLTRGISGQPKYPDNTVISVKQIFNTVTGTLENVYYFWVKNKVTVPDTKNRRTSSLQVSRYIADPISTGVRFAQILSSDSISFSNIQDILVNDKITSNLVIDTNVEDIPRHTEWLLLEENSIDSQPTDLLNKKLFDSLLGHDDLGNPVPDPALSDRSKFGISIRPQQTLFKDRLAAVRNVIEYANDVLIKQRIVGNYNFENLLKRDEIPDEDLGEYDYLVEDLFSLENNIDSFGFKQAIISCELFNGRINTIKITEPGFGYGLPPKITIIGDNQSAELSTEIDEYGRLISVRIVNPGQNYLTVPELLVRPHTVYVIANEEQNNNWTKHVYDYEQKFWTRNRTQIFDTTKFWNYVDWTSDDYDKYKDYRYVLADRGELTKVVDITPGEYIKITNIGNGKFAILRKTQTTEIGNFSSEYDIVYSQDGTIQINDAIWNYSISNWTYDDATLEETLYDQVPDLELFYILTALKDNIFIDENKIYWNNLFFKAVKYALTEQKFIDWAFKTSFISVKNTVGELDQRPVYKLDNEYAYEQYLYEVKPYHTKIRNYSSSYSIPENDNIANILVTDFDLPAYYNSSTQKNETIGLGNSKLDEYPWKSWADNYKYTITDIAVGNEGAGYSTRPTVQITTATNDNGYGLAAEAYIRNGKLFAVKVTSPGYNYVVPPTIEIIGGGDYVTSTATAIAILGDTNVRTNKLTMRFDRLKAEQEIDNLVVTDEIICIGNTRKYNLTWLADPDKIKIIPLLDSKLILATDYTIEYYKDNKGYNRTKCRFVFLNYTPVEGQRLKITYSKNVDLFTAADRFTNLYSPTDTMPTGDLGMLIEGAEFPKTQIKGLDFNYSLPFNGENQLWNAQVWEDLIDYYATARINQTTYIGNTILDLNTVENISPGQTINILGTANRRIREGTTVVSVDPELNQITLSSPSYRIKRMRANGLTTTATIEISTDVPFTGNIRSGDIAFVTGIDNGIATGFDGFYTVHEILGNSKFSVTATNVLSTTTVGRYSSSSIVTISPILETISSNVLMKTVNETFSGTSTYVVNSGLMANDIYQMEVYLNGVTPPIGDPEGEFPLAEYHQIVTDSNGQRKIIFYQLGLLNVYTIEIRFYTGPLVEFWNYDYNFVGSDSNIEGGAWSTQSNALIGALGINPEDIKIDGSSFLNADYGYAPEENVPGHVMDSLGINVYTKAEDSYPLVITNYIRLEGNNQVSRHRLGKFLHDSAGILVHCDGVIYERMESDLFTEVNQFYLDGEDLVVAGRPTSGLLCYTIIQLGGIGDFDSNVISVTDKTEALCSSLLHIDDVKKAYVLVNGIEISEIIGDPEVFGSVGYVLTNIDNQNKRACVKVYNLPSVGTSSIEAWFFRTRYTEFNRVNSQIISIVSPTQFDNLLTIPPSEVEPQTIHSLVEQYSINSTDVRQLLTPPYISYYSVQNNQRIFNIDDRGNLLEYPSSELNYTTVYVYANGSQLRPGFDFLIDAGNRQIILTDSLLENGSVLAIMPLFNHDYYINNGILHLANPQADTEVKVITFSNHDEMFMRTERFKGTSYRRYVLTRPTINDDFVWVYVNGQPLTARYDYEILDDYRTIQLNEYYLLTPSDEVVIISVDPPVYGDTILGFRIFNDAFGRYHYKRLSSFYTTTLLQELRPDDTEIVVDDVSRLVPPNPAKNKPGIIIVDRERIEFLNKEGNVLKNLRRSTLGTGPATVAEIGTKVIDQSPQNTIPYEDLIKVQKTTSTESTVYYIDTGTISLSTASHAVDQVMVYYGGRLLRKTSIDLHDRTVSYDTTASSIVTLAPEFTINTSTNAITLNINGGINSGTSITIVQRIGQIWTGSESLLTSNVVQAKFLRDKQAELPDINYYGGDPSLLDENYNTLTDENGSPLEEY